MLTLDYQTQCEIKRRAAAAEEPPETDSPVQDEGPVTQRKAVMTKCNDGNRPEAPKSERNVLCTLSGRDFNLIFPLARLQGTPG